MAEVGRWELPGDATAARVARQHLRRAGTAWPGGFLDVVLLLATELVTNAVRHGMGPVLLQLERTGAAVRITVHDTGPGAPSAVTQFPESTAEGGRGLPLLSALADEWGSELYPGAPGKRTWFTVRTDR